MSFDRFRIWILFLVLFPIFSWGFQLDWSGYYLGSIFYEYNLSDKQSFISPEQHLLMNSTARVSDGLSVNSRFLLGFNKMSTSGFSRAKNHISNTEDAVLNSNAQSFHLNPVYFYAQYNNEFMQVEYGRLPFSFGLGLTYSAGDHFLETAYDVRDGISLKIEYNSFYLKPYGIIYFKEQFGDQIVGKGREFAFALEAGYETKDLETRVLHKTAIMNTLSDKINFLKSPYRPESTTNIFGRYNYNESLSFSAEWGSQGAGWSQYAATLGLDWQTNFHSLALNLIGGYVTENYMTNTNWPPSFMLWDYFYIPMGKDKKDHSSGLSNAIAFYSSASLDLGDYFNVSLAHVWMADKSNVNIANHELQAVLTYDSKKGFQWENKFGYIFMKENSKNKNHIGLRSAAVVHF